MTIDSMSEPIAEDASVDDVVKRFADARLVPHGLVDVSLGRFDGPESLGTLHSAATRLSSRFDHYAEEVTWRLDEALAGLDAAQTRLSYEIEALESDVQALARDVTKAAQPRQATAKQETNEDGKTKTPGVAQRLERLETARAKMQEVMAVFEAARAFDEDQITREVLSLAGNKDGGAAARARVNEARKLIEVWKGTTVYGQRQRFVTGLSKRVEAIVGAQAEQERRPGAASSASGVSDSDRSREATPSEGYYSLINQFQRKIF